MDRLTAHIGISLADNLGGFRFVKTTRRLLKDTEEGWQAIAVAVVRTSKPHMARLASHAQIRIDAIEDVYGPHHPFLDAKAARKHATLTLNCDKLLSNSPLIHGFANDDRSVQQFISH